VREIRTGVNFVAAAVVDQVRSQCSTSRRMSGCDAAERPGQPGVDLRGPVLDARLSPDAGPSRSAESDRVKAGGTRPDLSEDRG
jgi:hypothetical protein